MGGQSGAQIGVLGMGVMGRSLTLNFAERGIRTAAWNGGAENLERLRKDPLGPQVNSTNDLRAFVASLERPRRAILMVTAGEATDALIERMVPLLEAGDIIVDGGNALFKDTQRRERALAQKSLRFVGMGVSGGEEGARRGPSMMPGGASDAYQALEPLLKTIAAKTDSGACVTHVGPDGAGHFVKMVHNGIEYADMQLIAEAYALLRQGLGAEAKALSDIFADWNRGPSGSFLIEITAQVLRVKDRETQRPLVDLILDKAGQKGTGRWTVEVALENGVPVPSIAAALDARLLSSWKDERVAASRVLNAMPASSLSSVERETFVRQVHDAMLAAKVCTYAQGFRLIQTVSRANNWNVNLAEMARIWKGGCIIRARLLDPMMQAFARSPETPSLMLEAPFSKQLIESQRAWREVASMAIRWGVAVPALTASLAYFDQYRSAELPANLIQAQRDAFGAHTYERRDQPGRGAVHTDWTKELA
ncbi:MAG: NADP-dependent phosphogluconate dehydrogenase [Myxococcaceae bacterium]